MQRTHQQAESQSPDPQPQPGGVLSQSFKTREVVDLLGLSRRQLQYWAKTELVEPSTRTSGGHHRYSFDDLVALKATKRLIDAGISVQKIRKSVRALQALLPQVGHPLSELVLVATGDVVLVFREDAVFEAVSGQEWIFEVADFEREVEAYRRLGTGRARKQGPEEASATVLPARPGPRPTRRLRRKPDGEKEGKPARKPEWSQAG
jgi:DNA-binding transcriptional MerR regulator